MQLFIYKHIYIHIYSVPRKWLCNSKMVKIIQLVSSHQSSTSGKYCPSTRLKFEQSASVMQTQSLPPLPQLVFHYFPLFRPIVSIQEVTGLFSHVEQLKLKKGWGSYRPLHCHGKKLYIMCLFHHRSCWRRLNMIQTNQIKLLPSEIRKCNNLVFCVILWDSRHT